MEQKLVLTPGGFRNPSLVHRIEPGQVLHHTRDRLQQLHPSGKVIAEFTPPQITAADMPLTTKKIARVVEGGPTLGSGWIAYAHWNNTTGKPISLFKTTWVVPPPHASG